VVLKHENNSGHHRRNGGGRKHAGNGLAELLEVEGDVADLPFGGVTDEDEMIGSQSNPARHRSSLVRTQQGAENEPRDASHTGLQGESGFARSQKPAFEDDVPDERRHPHQSYGKSGREGRRQDGSTRTGGRSESITELPLVGREMLAGIRSAHAGNRRSGD